MKCPLIEDRDTYEIVKENVELRKLLDEVMKERNYYKGIYESRRDELDCDDWG